MEMKPLYVALSNEHKSIRGIRPGVAKPLNCPDDVPVMRVNKTYCADSAKLEVTVTITYKQYILKPGFTKEAYELAVNAYDKAAEEYQSFREECLGLGMDV